MEFARAWAEIDLARLGANLGLLKERVAAPIALVIKADAYGHGMIPCARQAVRSGCEWLCVAAAAEGAALRDAGIDCRILVLSPILEIEAEQAVFYELDVTVEGMRVPKALSKAASSTNRRACIHLKVDTGLHRLGCDPVEVKDLVEQISALPSVEMVALCQHFSDSSGNPKATQRQFETFLEATDGMDLMRHASNSYGALHWPDARLDLVRTGLLAYGVDPRGDVPELQAVMSLYGRVVADRWIGAGERVGYLGEWKAERRSRILTVGAGYGDGLPRNAAGLKVTSAGQAMPIVGLVCMDQLMVDATDASGIGVGDAVMLFGDDPTAADAAQVCGTNSHEIVTRIMPRVPRRYAYSD